MQAKEYKTVKWETPHSVSLLATYTIFFRAVLEKSSLPQKSGNHHKTLSAIVEYKQFFHHQLFKFYLRESSTKSRTKAGQVSDMPVSSQLSPNQSWLQLNMYIYCDTVHGIPISLLLQKNRGEGGQVIPSDFLRCMKSYFKLSCKHNSWSGIWINFSKEYVCLRMLHFLHS